MCACTSVCRWVGHAWRVDRSWWAVKLARRAGVRGFSDTSCRAGSYTMKRVIEKPFWNSKTLAACSRQLCKHCTVLELIVIRRNENDQERGPRSWKARTPPWPRQFPMGHAALGPVFDGDVYFPLHLTLWPQLSFHFIRSVSGRPMLRAPPAGAEAGSRQGTG